MPGKKVNPIAILVPDNIAFEIISQCFAINSFLKKRTVQVIRRDQQIERVGNRDSSFQWNPDTIFSQIFHQYIGSQTESFNMKLEKK
jgi:hypothetical protein